MPPLTRREFLAHSLTAASIVACGSDLGDIGSSYYGNPRISAPPTSPNQTPPSGETRLGLGSDRDASLYVPPSYDPTKPAPLVLGLHGAGGLGTNFVNAMRPAADSIGAVVLAPDSRGRTWDGISGVFTDDIDFITATLKYTYDRVNVDAARMTIAGFSDGATYSLTLGLANGDLFPQVIAFSPGFIVRTTTRGHPRFFFAHGTNDTILPIDQCSRVLVPQLKSEGYDVTYHEFAGGHGINAGERDFAFAWITTPQ